MSYMETLKSVPVSGGNVYLDWNGGEFRAYFFTEVEGEEFNQYEAQHGDEGFSMWCANHGERATFAQIEQAIDRIAEHGFIGSGWEDALEAAREEV